MFIIIMSLSFKKYPRRLIYIHKLASLNKVSILNYVIFLRLFLSLYAFSTRSNMFRILFLYSFLFYNVFTVISLNTYVGNLTNTRFVSFFLNKSVGFIFSCYSIVYSVLPVSSLHELANHKLSKQISNQQPCSGVCGKLQFSTELAQLDFVNDELSKFEIFFLRKNRVFNKGRYSRNRQNYRTGVYICFYLSIISIFGLYYTFYRFSFNLSYFWFGFIFFAGSFFFSKLLRYNLWSFSSIRHSISRLLNWIFLLRL